MSANAQGQFEQANTNSDLEIRSGALHGPMNFISARDPRESRRLRKELVNIDIPEQAEQFMPVKNYLEILARLDHITDSTTMILQAALSQDLSELGLLGKAIIHAENLWSALQTAQVGINYIQSGSRIELRIRYGRCRVTYHHPFGKGRSQSLDVQYTIGLLCNILSESANTPAASLRIGYPGAQPEHERLFGNLGRVSGGEYGMVEFDDQLLRSPLRRSSPIMAEVISAAMEESPDQPDNEPEFSALVWSLQTASIENQHRPLSQIEVSWLLDVPVRTLQHTLKSEGVRFDQLRDKSRHKLARQALLNGREIEEISHNVGFAHRQSFSEAFSKWEGCSPSEFRSRSHIAAE